MSLPDFETTITWLYQGTAIVTCFAYLPQIIKLIYAKDQTRAISLTTWITWTITSLIALLYSIYVTDDAPFILMASVNLTGCGIITLLAINNRYFRFKDNNDK